MKNEVRIIGGTWRSRKIRFPVAPGLRPTPDRVRETLFNWLGQDLEGLVCLNLYAGSGVLGFEAASRGATRVVQVERNPEACLALKQNCGLLDAETVQIVQMDVSRFLAGSSERFDVVFLDPPFQQGLVEPCCRLLEEKDWLAPMPASTSRLKKGKFWTGCRKLGKAIAINRLGEWVIICIIGPPHKQLDSAILILALLERRHLCRH